jgi:hypothetical protein
VRSCQAAFIHSRMLSVVTIRNASAPSARIFRPAAEMGAIAIQPRTSKQIVFSAQRRLPNRLMAVERDVWPTWHSDGARPPRRAPRRALARPNIPPDARVKCDHELSGHPIGRNIVGIARPDETGRRARDERHLGVGDVGLNAMWQAQAADEFADLPG